MASSVRGAARREQILQAAIDQFDQHGFHSTSLQAIATAVGIRKASLYYYFPNKDAILRELHDRMIDEVTSKHQDRVSAAELSATDLLGAMMNDVIGLMETQPGHLRVFFESFHGLSPDIQRHVSDARAGYRHTIRDVIEAGRRDGELEVADADLASLAVLSLMNWTYQWFDTNGRLSAAEVADGYLHLILNGMAAR